MHVGLINLVISLGIAVRLTASAEIDVIHFPHEVRLVEIESCCENIRPHHHSTTCLRLYVFIITTGIKHMRGPLSMSPIGPSKRDISNTITGDLEKL